MTETENWIKVLSEAPSTQIDPLITAKLKDLLTIHPVQRPDLLRNILDECTYGALASGFSMTTMDIVWKLSIEDASEIHSVSREEMLSE